MFFKNILGIIVCGNLFAAHPADGYDADNEEEFTLSGRSVPAAGQRSAITNTISPQRHRRTAIHVFSALAPREDMEHELPNAASPYSHAMASPQPQASRQIVLRQIQPGERIPTSQDWQDHGVQITLVDSSLPLSLRYPSQGDTGEEPAPTATENAIEMLAPHPLTVLNLPAQTPRSFTGLFSARSERILLMSYCLTSFLVNAAAVPFTYLNHYETNDQHTHNLLKASLALNAVSACSLTWSAYVFNYKKNFPPICWIAPYIVTEIVTNCLIWAAYNAEEKGNGATQNLFISTILNGWGMLPIAACFFAILVSDTD